MKKTLYVISLMMLLLPSTNMVAQHWCGTSDSDQKLIKEEFDLHRDAWLNTNQIRSGAITYIPVKFHLINKGDGTGAPLLHQIYAQLCKLNTDYAPYEMQFYLKGGIEQGIIHYSDDRIWTDPNSGVSTQLLRNAKAANNDAINIIVNDVVQAGEPGVLGRFYRDNDYIIIQRGEVVKLATSLTHELGHFFGLSHTFYGWEITDYDCNQTTPQTVFLGAIGVPVEYESRTKRTNGQLNCLIAGDGLCDTGPDYNLGLGYTGPCSWNGCAKDPDGVTFTPPTENIMGYFLNCLEVFTADQVTVMKSSYLSGNRSYIRSAYVPSLDEITEAPQAVYPGQDETTSYFDEVELEWEPVDGAQAYIVNVDRTPGFTTGFFEEVTDETTIMVTGMSPNLRYYWRVTPISEYHNCVTSVPRNRFRTSGVMTSSRDIDGLTGWDIRPNPSSTGQNATLEITLSKNMEVKIEIVSTNGQVIETETLAGRSGVNSMRFNDRINPGVYLVRISDAQGGSDMRKWIKFL